MSGQVNFQGRTTDWAQLDSGAEIPCGQRMLNISDSEVPMLEIRVIEFDTPHDNA